MRKIVDDTNIIFSCLLHSDGSIGDLIFNSNDVFQFYSCDYMRLEIHKHWSKLLRISKLNEAQLRTAYDKLLSRLIFLNEELIPLAIWQKAETTIASIDLDDIDFVALTRFIKGGLWTGDKKLYEGLKDLRFKQAYNTQDMLRLRNRLTPNS